MQKAAPRLTISLSNGESVSVAKLEGVIDESLAEDAFVGTTHALLIDLGGVTRITSYGVRQWISALKSSSAPYIGFCNVPECMVTQFNVVGGFAGSGQLLTVKAPFVCPACGHVFSILQDVRRDWAALTRWIVAPALCPQCSKEAELDDSPEAYFFFLSGMKQPSPPQAISDFLDGTPTERGARPLKVAKHIAGTVTCFWLVGALNERARLKRLADGLEGDVLIEAHSVTSVNEKGLATLVDFLRKMSVDVWVHALNPRLVEALQELQPPLSHVHFADVDNPLPKTIDDYLARHPDGPPNFLGDGGGGKDSVAGKYRLVRKLGSGGMAEVFLAQLDGPGGFEKKVVVKRILPHLVSEPSFVRMLLQEAKLAARISHPNVVQIFEIGHDTSEFFIAMEYVRGADLRALMKASSREGLPVPVGIALRIMSDVCGGLYSAHSSTDETGQAWPIIHRDVSPHNVLMSREGSAKLTDFGIAKASDIKSDTPSTTLKGKIAYLAPELARADEAAVIDHRVDIFAVGIVFYQLLTGKQPFLRSTDAETLYALINAPVPPPSSFRGEIPATVDQIIFRALERNPLKRTSSALLMQSEIEAVLTTPEFRTSTQDVARWVGERLEGMRARGELLDTSVAPNVADESAPHEATAQTEVDREKKPRK